MSGHGLRAVVPLLLVLLGACAGAPPPREVPVHGMLARIEAAAAADGSAVTVVPLRAPGVEALQAAAEHAMRRGDADTAAIKLARALQLEPDSPPVLQTQAELAIYRQQWALAQQKALASWQLGPRSGPLCARNWQTVVEVQAVAGSAAGVDRARQGLARCRIEGVQRY